MGVRADSNRSSNGQTQTMSFVVGVPTLRRIRWTSTTHSHLHSRTKRLWPFWFSPLHTWRLAHTRSPHSSHLINYFPHHWSVILTWRPQGTEELPLRDLAPHLQLALQSQLDIGWYTLLCGFVTKHFKSIQTEYYQQLGKRNSGWRWAIQLIGKLWQITHSMRCHWNEALHESPSIINSRRHGLDQLHTAVRAELQQGLDQLAPLYQGYFCDNAITLLSKPADCIKRWFLVIRIAREGNDTDQQDGFTHNPTLQSWIMLP